MLYLFINAETEASQLQLCHTLAAPEGAVLRYGYIFAGSPHALRQKAREFDRVNRMRDLLCAVIVYDEKTKQFIPMRRGTLINISGFHDGREIPHKKTIAMCKKGKLELSVRVRMGKRLYAPDLKAYNENLRHELNLNLPGETAGSVLLHHYIIAVPPPTDDNVFPLLARDLAALPHMSKSRHRVLIQCDTVAIPTARKRLLRVQGHNFDSSIRAIGAVTNHTLTHIQSIPPDSDFTFFASLPPIPDGRRTAITELDTCLALCLVE